MQRVGVVDYGSGNVRSVLTAVRRIQPHATLVDSSSDFASCNALVVPGVGSLSGFMNCLTERSLLAPLRHAIRAATPVLSICVGMHALGSGGSESPTQAGLGVIPDASYSLRELGVVKKAVPQIGWNRVSCASHLHQQSPLWVLDDRDVFFMHSYAFASNCSGWVAQTTYEVAFCSAIEVGSVLGIQFHPEKSHSAGMDFLEAWLESCK